MKTITSILSSLLLLFIAFSCEKGNESEATPGGAASGIRFPSGSEYSVGEDVIILCSGIAPGAALYLVSTDGSQTLVGNPTITASGIFFTVDAGLGIYTVVVEQDGERRELGSISVVAAAIDVMVNDVPAYCIPGETFSVTGSGFDDSAVLTLMNPEGTRTALETEVSGNSLSATVPSDAPRGKMRLLIVQDDGEMTAREAFFVTTRKRLSSVIYTIGAGNATYEHSYELHVKRAESGEISGFEEYDMSISDAGDGTVYAFDPVSEDSGYTDFSMTVRGNQVASVTFESAGEYVSFDWEYEADGFLYYAVGNGSSYTTLFLGNADGSLDFSELYIDCDCSDASLVNNPFALDFALGILAADNEVLRVAQAMGFTGTVSERLPASLDGKPVTYVYDDEGYVIKASYTDPYSSFETEIEYTYE